MTTKNSRGRQYLATFALGVSFIVPAPGWAAGKPPAERADQSAQATQQTLDSLKAKQQELLDQIRGDVAALPPLPEPTPGEPESIAELRKRREVLLRLLKEIEDRIASEDAGRTAYVSSLSRDPVLKAYYDRLSARIEKYGTDHFPKNGKTSIYGRAVVTIAIDSHGKLESVNVARSSSKQLSDHAVSLIRQSAPFEPFPADMASRIDRIVITSFFSFERN
jgi:TonB family protein